MKISFIGAGNVALGMASFIPEEHSIYFHSSKPEGWSEQLTYIDKVTRDNYTRKIDTVSSSYELVVTDADFIFITHPAFMLENTIDKMRSFIKKGAKIGVVPGTGGAEYFINKIAEKDAILFGLDRVPCVARILKYGDSVIASKKKKTRLAAIPRKYTDEIASEVSILLGMDIEPLPNFLTVTFTPSNPIVHTARLFSLLNADQQVTKKFEYNIPFYGEWDDLASKMLIGCDNELQKICNVLSNLDMSKVIPLTDHYEISSIEELTSKIKSIETMSHILSPMLKEENHFIIDKSSRYFEEDFPYGLCVLKGFAVVCKIETPYMDKILKWYEKFSGVQYFINNEFIGRDLKETAIPQNYNLDSIEKIEKFYSK